MYLAKVLQNMERAGMLQETEMIKGNSAYRPRMSYFSFYRRPDTYLFNMLLWPMAHLFKPKAHRDYSFKGLQGFVVAFILLLTPSPVAAQQTIYNVPSADITPEGQLFLQHESQFRAWEPGHFVDNTEYSAYGIGHHTELDATLFNVNAPVSDNITLGLGFKTTIPLLEERLPEEELKWTIGTIVPVSLQGDGVGNWSYSHLSARLPRVKTRLTAGVSAGTHQIFGRNAVAFIGGVEQPVSKHVTILTDWYSGTHNLGLLISGFSLALPKDTNLYLGYQIPNTKRSGSQGLVIELSKLMF
jgi:hypothetical protein